MLDSRRPFASLALAALLTAISPPVTAQSGPRSVLRFNADYHLGEYGLSIPLTSGGRPTRLLATRGRLALRADGSQTAHLTSREIFANPASDRSSNGARPGTWFLHPDGRLDLDRAPAAPGTDLRRGFVTPDGAVIVGTRSATDADADSYLMLALRHSTGLSATAAQGSYATLRVSLSFDPGGGIRGTTSRGTAVFDGRGAFTFTGQHQSVRGDGSRSTGPVSHNGSYSIAADGGLTLDGVDRGGIASDGNLLFASVATPREVGLTVAVRSASGLSMDDVVGDWAIAFHELESGSAPSRPLASTGLGSTAFSQRNPSTGDYRMDGHFVEDTPSSSTSAHSTVRGPLRVAGPSTLRADPAAPEPLDLLISRDHALLVGSGLFGRTELLVGLRTCGGTRAYGAATPGSGGIAPGIGIRDFPTLGNPNFALELFDGRGGAGGLMAVSVHDSTGLPFLGGTLHLDPSLLADGFPISLSGPAGVPGAGRGALPFTVPSDPALAGFELYWQLITLDPGGPAGFAMSRGFALRFCR